MGTGTLTALSVVQLIAFIGYVGVGGLLMFRAVITPDRGRERRIVQIGALGLGLVAVAAVARAVVLLAAGYGGGATVPVLVVQLGVLAAVACYLPDLFGSALQEWRRGTAVAAAVLLTVALLLPVITAAGGRAAFGGLLTAAHVLAIGTWVGGMVVVALLVLPADAPTGRVFTVLQVLLRRTQGKAIGLVVVLVLTWLVALFLLPGRTSGLPGAFWTVLALKVVLVAGLVAAAVRVRTLIGREVFRSTHIGAAAAERLATLRRLITVEIAIAAAAVAATAVLTVVTPLG